MQYIIKQMDKSHYMQLILVSLKDILQLSVRIPCSNTNGRDKNPQIWGSNSKSSRITGLRPSQDRHATFCDISPL